MFLSRVEIGKFGRMCVRKLFNRLIKRDSGFDWSICRNWKRRIFRRCIIQTVTLHRSASLYRMFSIVFLFRVINLFRFVFGSLSLRVTSHHLSFPAVFNLPSLNLWRLSWSPLAIAAIFNVSIHHKEDHLTVEAFNCCILFVGSILKQMRYSFVTVQGA